jgi:hypothetical protein
MAPVALATVAEVDARVALIQALIPEDSRDRMARAVGSRWQLAARFAWV